MAISLAALRNLSRVLMTHARARHARAEAERVKVAERRIRGETVQTSGDHQTLAKAAAERDARGQKRPGPPVSRAGA